MKLWAFVSANSLKFNSFLFLLMLCVLNANVNDVIMQLVIRLFGKMVER